MSKSGKDSIIFSSILSHITKKLLLVVWTVPSLPFQKPQWY